MTSQRELRLGVVIVAAGTGQRFGDPDKVFLPLCGRPVLSYSLELFISLHEVEAIVVVLGTHTIDRGRDLIALTHDDRISTCVGGDTRSDSVRAGIQALPDDVELIAVHDAGRPLASLEMTRSVIQSARNHGAAVPAVSLNDTIARIEPDRRIASIEPREQLIAVQTPQVARRDWLEHSMASESDFSDEGGALLAAGYAVMTVDGSADNAKLTWPDDLKRAEFILGENPFVIRIGLGYDIHRFVEGRPLILAGVVFESEQGLEGHSDADVILHAVADAVLGAAALGDIGDHFPPTDERWRDADSGYLLKMVVSLVNNRYTIGNVDVTMVGEEPRIAPKRMQMRQNLAGLLGIDLDRVSIKATTNERLGALGRTEGVAAIASVLLEEKS